MTLDTRLYEGNRAREILESDVFNGAFDAIEAEVIDKWKNSPARDSTGRESLWTYLQLLQKLKAQLTSTMESGKLAALDIQHSQTMRDKLKTVWDGMRSA